MLCDLGPEAETALESEGLTGHILEVGMSKHYAGTADILLGIAETSNRRSVNILFKRIGVSVLELFKLSGPCQRAYNIYVDVVSCPLGSGYSGETTDTFLGGGVSALAVVAEKTCAGCEVDNAALGLLEVGVASLHIVERCIKAGIHSKVKLLGGMIGQSNAGSGSLSVVDKNVDAAEFLDGLIDYGLGGSGVVVACGDVALQSEDLDAVESFELFLSLVELLYIAACDNDVGAFLGVGVCDAVADGAGLAVGKDSSSAAGDDNGFTC